MDLAQRTFTRVEVQTLHGLSAGARAYLLLLPRVRFCPLPGVLEEDRLVVLKF